MQGKYRARCSIRFHLRVPPEAATDFATQYRACLDMSEWADRVGFDEVLLAEHHGEPAGFMPAPLTLAGAVLARTTRISVTVLVLAPLHDPVRIAEQLATLACIAPGRVRAIVGAGYRRADFEMAGVDRSDRGTRVDQLVELCRQAWTGHEFQWQGRNIAVTPPPPPGQWPRLVLGGKSAAAARRAARLGCDFGPSSSEPTVIAAYHEACEQLGRRGEVTIFPSGFLMVAERPDQAWEVVGPHALMDAHAYESWQADAVRSDGVVLGAERWTDLRASGKWQVLTPAECIEQADRTGILSMHPLMGGLAPELAWPSLRLVESDVLPHLRDGTTP
jgi:alkanesulfonate monooxygenase SsuD/methylene tetrahydromethanopterin reductase-like flavin-dependent oxidoreductase (luciferase family)